MSLLPDVNHRSYTQESPKQVGITLHRSLEMGSRPQLFIVARIKGRYRCLAALHNQVHSGDRAMSGIAENLSG